MIAVDGDRATGLLTWAWVARGNGDVPEMRLLGTYEDTYVREHGRWRFRTRIARTDIPYREREIPVGWGDGGPAGQPEPVLADTETRLRRLEDLARIRQLVAEHPVADDRAGPGEGRHVIVNPVIELDPDDGDRARAELTWLYLVKGDDGGPTLASLGHCHDELVREAGQWRLLRRQAPSDIG